MENIKFLHWEKKNYKNKRRINNESKRIDSKATR